MARIDAGNDLRRIHLLKICADLSSLSRLPIANWSIESLSDHIHCAPVRVVRMLQHGGCRLGVHKSRRWVNRVCRRSSSLIVFCELLLLDSMLRLPMPLVNLGDLVQNICLLLIGSIRANLPCCCRHLHSRSLGSVVALGRGRLIGCLLLHEGQRVHPCSGLLHFTKNFPYHSII